MAAGECNGFVRPPSSLMLGIITTVKGKFHYEIDGDYSPRRDVLVLHLDPVVIWTP